jgi:phage terminase small subunit
MVIKSKRSRVTTPAPRISSRSEAAKRREVFTAEYLKNPNGTQAAIKAGFSPRSAHDAAHRLMKHPDVQAALAKVRAKVEAKTAAVADKLEITAERVLQELAKIGFSDLRRVAKWGNGLDLIASDKLDDATAGAVSEVAMTKYGPRIKLYDKRAALVDLGKHVGVFKDGADISVPVTFVVQRTSRSRPRRPYEEDDAP